MSAGAGVDISGLPKSSVLAVLYNAAAPHRLGFLQYTPVPMMVEEAQAVLDHRDPEDQMMLQARRMGLTPEHPGWVWARHCFYYLNGRPLFVDISRDTLDPARYDEKQGPGAAASAIGTLRDTGEVDTTVIRRAHLNRTIGQAKIAWHELGESWAGIYTEQLRLILEPILKKSGH